MIRIRINGEERELAQALSVDALLDALGYAGRPVAVAVNHTCVRKSELASSVVGDGDEVEILSPMAGG